MTTEPVELPQVVAQNVRRLRGAKTMENLAAAGQEYGTNWSSGSIGSIERGQFKVTLENLAILAQALADLHGDGTKQSPLPLVELLKTDAPIKLTNDAVTPPGDLQEWLAGGSLRVRPDPRVMEEIKEAVQKSLDRLNELTLPDITRKQFKHLPKPTPGDKRVAKQAGIDPVELVAWSFYLWGKGFEQHRDAVSGEDSTAQKKGRVSRRLREQILDAMEMQRGDR